jgi:hypothetical protein
MAKDKNHLILCFIAIAVYPILQVFQLNIIPLQRYPNWDAFWVDSINYGQLATLKAALLNFEIPAISPYIGFGTNFAGDAANPVSFLSPIHWSVLYLPIEAVVQMRVIILFMIGMGSTFLFIKELTKNKSLAFLISMLYISFIQENNSLLYGTVYISFVYFIPGVLYIIHKIYSNCSLTWLLFFVAYSLFASTLGNVYALIFFVTAIGTYTFIIGINYFRNSVSRSLLTSCGLLILWLMGSASYVLPFLDNTLTHSIETAQVVNTGFYSPIIVSLPYLIKFLNKNLFWTFFLPSCGIYYVPFFCYVTLIACCLFRKRIFQDNTKNLFAVVCALLLTAFMMFLEIFVIYALPFLSKFSPSIIRLQTYSLPFLILIATSLCIYAATLAAIKNKALSSVKKSYFFYYFFAFLFISSFSIDVGICIIRSNFLKYIIPNAQVWYDRFAIPSYKLSQVKSGNVVPVTFLKDMWSILPFMNLGAFLSIILVSWSQFFNFSLRKFAHYSVLTYGVFISLFSLSVNNELRNQKIKWHWQTNSSHLWDAYKERKQCINSLTHRTPELLMNFRTLYTGSPGDNYGRARNWKFIAETEAHPLEREKVLFSYREVNSPYVGLIWSAFFKGKNFLRDSLFPPAIEGVDNSIDLARFIGVKWIISADAQLKNKFLTYKGTCHTKEEGPLLGKKSSNEGGDFYIYELSNPLGLAFFINYYEILPHKEIITRILKGKELPWTKSIVYLEEDPGFSNNFEVTSPKNDINNSVEIIHETLNEVILRARSNQEKFLILSYLYSPRWSAYINDIPQKVFRAYGGFMAIKIPAGNHNIKFSYSPTSVWLGLLISFGTILTLLIIIFVRKIRYFNVEK